MLFWRLPPRDRRHDHQSWPSLSSSYAHTLEVGTLFAVELCRAEIYGIARSDVDVDADGERGISVGNPLYSHGHGPGLSV